MNHEQREPDCTSSVRRQIQISLTVGLVLLVVLFVDVSLYLILRSTNDPSAALAMGTVVLVNAALFALAAAYLLWLVARVLLAFLEQADKLASSDQNDKD